MTAYTSWDYDSDVVDGYYNLARPDGVPVDGVNDDAGQVDSLPVTGTPAFFDAPDPTFDAVTAVDRPEQVAGRGYAGSVVYAFEFVGPTSRRTLRPCRTTATTPASTTAPATTPSRDLGPVRRRPISA